jgi:hypothetical protein
MPGKRHSEEQKRGAHSFGLMVKHLHSRERYQASPEEVREVLGSGASLAHGINI